MTTEQRDLQKQLQTLDSEIREKRQEYVKLAKQLGGEKVSAYTLKAHSGEDVTLGDLFGDKDDLIIVHNMGTHCQYCTLWADGFNHLTPHLEDRAAFVMVSPDPIDVQSEFRTSRNWQFQMVSGHDSTFIQDMGFRHEDEENAWWMPGFSVFKRSEDGQIKRVAKDFFGPGDMYCSLWHFFDLLDDGVNQWQPQFNY